MIEIKEHIPLAPYTIYKIGGPARYFTEVKNAEDLREAVQYAAEKQAPFFILGAGSNVLIADRGYDGMAIRMTGGNVRVEGDRLIADAGVMMARAVTEAARHGLAGFEWGIGVPGTIGGSVRGNAGCFGGEMKDVVERVRVLKILNPKSEIRNKSETQNPKLEMVDIEGTACDFSYRDSVFKKHPEWIVLSATLRLQKGDPAAIQAEVRRITADRLAKQDIGAKCCGCMFKNSAWGDGSEAKDRMIGKFPELAAFTDRSEIPAAFLLDRAGLKGERKGHIVVSEKHANFFINEGGGCAADAAALIVAAKDAVRRKYGLDLEEEIQHVGFSP